MQKVVVITGANRGIGLSFAKHYLNEGYRVIGTSRVESPELTALKVHQIQLDVSSDQSIDQLPSQLKDIKIDLLINNAGYLVADTLENSTRQGMMDQFSINTIGPMFVTRALLPLMQENSRVVNISSSMGSIEENGSGAYYGYRASKAALNMVSKSLSLDLKPKGIAVLALHPGYIQTRMTSGKGEMSPEDSVARMIQVIARLTLENTGEFRHRDGRLIPY